MAQKEGINLKPQPDHYGEAASCSETSFQMTQKHNKVKTATL